MASRYSSRYGGPSQVSDGGNHKTSSNDAYRDSLWTDQMYLDAISQYKDKPWYNQLLENPYMRSKQADFVADPLTDMFNWEGAAANYYGGMRKDAMNWLADKLAQMNQQDYDSALSQVGRDAAAGINPDIAQNVSPGESAENDTPPTPSFANGGSETGASICAAGLNFIGSVLSFGQQIQALGKGSADLVASELSADDLARGSVTEQIASLLPMSDYDSPSDLDAVDIPAVVKQGSWKLSRFSPRSRKFLKNWLSRLKNGDSMAVEAIRSGLRKTILENNRASAEIKSSPYYDDDFNKWIGNIGENLTQFVALADSYSARIAAAQGEQGAKFWEDDSNKKKYFNLLGSDLDVKTEQNKSIFQSSKYQEEMEKTWNKLVKDVKGDGKHWYNTIGMILVMALRSQVMQPLHFGFSSASSQSPNRYGTSSFTSRSFHF